MLKNIQLHLKLQFTVHLNMILQSLLAFGNIYKPWSKKRIVKITQQGTAVLSKRNIYIYVKYPEHYLHYVNHIKVIFIYILQYVNHIKAIFIYIM